MNTRFDPVAAFPELAEWAYENRAELTAWASANMTPAEIGMYRDWSQESSDPERWYFLSINQTRYAKQQEAEDRLLISRAPGRGEFESDEEYRAMLVYRDELAQWYNLDFPWNWLISKPVKKALGRVQ